jgi:hypothetical protein
VREEFDATVKAIARPDTLRSESRRCVTTEETISSAICSSIIKDKDKDNKVRKEIKMVSREGKGENFLSPTVRVRRPRWEEESMGVEVPPWSFATRAVEVPIVMEEMEMRIAWMPTEVLQRSKVLQCASS